MSEKHTEQVLQELYVKRKAQVNVPKQLNDKVLTYARQTKSPIWRWLNGPAIVSAFILVIVFGIQRNTDMTDQTSIYTVSQGINSDSEVIYYHDVHIQTNEASNNKTLADDAQYEQYLAALSGLSDRKSLQGIITVNDDVVVIKVCDLGLVQLSHDILKQLGTKETINAFEIGAPVTLLADNRGRFQQILNSDMANYNSNSEMCE